MFSVPEYLVLHTKPRMSDLIQFTPDPTVLLRGQWNGPGNCKSSTVSGKCRFHLPPTILKSDRRVGVLDDRGAWFRQVLVEE